MRSCLELNATIVANEFIDCYMATANGEYVKVYLYILRHQGQIQDVRQIADELNHTESDIKRALKYWVSQGILEDNKDLEILSGTGKNCIAIMPEASGRYITADMPKETDRYNVRMISGSTLKTKTESTPGEILETVNLPCLEGALEKEAPKQEAGLPAESEHSKEPVSGKVSGKHRKMYTPEQVSRLSDEEDFSQLLYISQKYMNKVFTPRECEVFAYLYDGLHMSVELLEYLVEYCVQGSHFNIRYLESVALNWHKRGICTVDMAKDYTTTFFKEEFAVMRAFGINNRKPGEPEQVLIWKWFREFGFTREIVLEACNRTLGIIHQPSFSYADSILSKWNKAGVQTMADIQKIDEEWEREGKHGEKNQAAVRPLKNQFHNFEQRSTDYDAMVLERLKKRLGEN